MNVRVLEYLIALEETGSLTKAAERVNISPSALSQHLALQEKEFGTKLFIRKDNAFIPTEAGRIYIDTARRMVSVKELTYQKISNLINYEKQLVRVALCPEAMLTLGDKLIERLPELCSEERVIKFDIKEMSSAEGIEALNTGKADAGIFSPDADVSLKLLHTWELYKEEAVLTVPEAFSWPGGTINWDGLEKLPFIYTHSPDWHPRLHRLLSSRKTVFPDMHHAGNLKELVMMTQYGYGLSLLPSRLAKGLNCRIYHWEPENHYRMLLLMPRYKENPVLRDFLLSIGKTIDSDSL